MPMGNQKQPFNILFPPVIKSNSQNIFLYASDRKNNAAD